MVSLTLIISPKLFYLTSNKEFLIDEESDEKYKRYQIHKCSFVRSIWYSIFRQVEIGVILLGNLPPSLTNFLPLLLTKTNGKG
jgi:hypothetical protein